MEKEIDLFAEQAITSPIEPEEISQPTSNSEGSFTDIRSAFGIESKEVPIYLVEKNSIVYFSSRGRGVLQNEQGLRCIKVLNEDGKNKKNTTTGLSQFQALEKYSTFLDGIFLSHSRDSYFSTFSRNAKRTHSPAKK
jgi:hypothetical protein